MSKLGPLQRISMFLRNDTKHDELLENLLLFSDKNPGVSKLMHFLHRKVDKDLIKMVKEHQTQGQIEYDLVRSITGYFKFDSVFLKEVSEKGTLEDKVGVIANTFGWISDNSDATNAENFSLLFRALVVILKQEFDRRVVFCLNLVATHAIFSQITVLPEDSVEILCELFPHNASIIRLIIPVAGILMHIALQCESDHLIDILTKSVSLTLEKASNSDLAAVDYSDTIAVCETGIHQVDIRFVLLFTQIANSVDGNKSILRSYRRLPEFISLQLEKLSSEADIQVGLPKLTPSKSECGSLNLSISWDDLHDGLDKIDPISVSVFEVETKDLLNETQFGFLTKLRSLLSPTCREYRSAFVESYGQLIAKSIPNSVLSANLAFLISTYAGVRENSAEFFDAIDSIFDPQYTVFHGMNLHIHKLRQLLFDTVTASSPYGLRYFVRHSDKTPLLLAETIGRIHAKLGFLDLSTIFDDGTVAIITDSLVSLHSQPEEIMRRAWSTIFMFITAVLDNVSTLSVLMTHPSFSFYFLGLFPRKAFQSIVFTALQKFLVTTKQCDTVVEFCTNMFEVASRNTKYIQEAASFISKLKDSLSFNPILIPFFKDLAHKSLDLIVKEPRNESMVGLLSFFAVIHMNVEGVDFEEREIVALAHVFREMRHSDEGLGLLASILAKRKSSSFGSTFLIQNYNIFPMLLSYGNLKDSIKFLCDLCHYSLFNMRQCHLGGYDLFLLTLLQNFNRPFRFGDVLYDPSGIDRGFITEVIFPLLSRMSEYWSSGEIASKFLCLSIPNENGVYPELTQEAMDVFVKSLNEIARTQVPVYQFSKSSKAICFSDIKGSVIEGGFTFVAWVLIDTPTTLTSSHPAFFSIYTEEEVEESIILFLSGSSIHAQFATADDDSTSSIIVAPEISSGRWHMMTFVYVPIDSETAKVRFSLDAGNWSTSMVQRPCFEDKEVTIQIGGFITNYEICDSFTFVGPFRVLNCPLNDKDRDKDVVEMFTQSIHSDSITGDFLKQKQPEPSVSGLYSLLRAIRENDITNYLLPFFMFCETAPPHFLDMIINIMTLSNENLNYRILGRIISKWSPASLTYSVYLKFFDLLSVTNNRELLMYVVLNPDTWSRAAGNRIVKILAHWSNTLIVSHPQLVAQAFGFSQVLAKALALQRSVSSDEKLDMEVVYKLSTQLLVQYHAYEPNPSNSLHLFSHLYKSDNEREMIYLIGLLRSIGGLADVESLYFFLSHTNPDLFCETVHTILTLAAEQAPQQIDMILCQMSSKHMNVELFEKLIAMVPEFPILVIPAAMIAFSVDGLPDKLCPVLGTLCTKEKQLKEIVKVNYWFIWLILATLRLDSERQNQGIVLVHSLYEHDKSYQTFDAIMCFLDIVDVTNVFDSLYFACSFLKLVCDVDISTSDDQRVNLFLQRCFRFLFFSFNKRTNLTAIFTGSPFDIQEAHVGEKLVPKGSMLVIDRPIAFLAGLLESAYKMELNLSFCALIKADGSDLIMGQLLMSVFDIVNQRNMRAGDDFSFLNVILYFRDRKLLDVKEKAKALAKFNAHLGKIGLVMAFLYTKTLRVTTQRILASIKSSMNACESASVVKSDISDLAEYELANMNSVAKKRHETMELEWNKFIIRYMDSMSIWSHVFRSDFVLSTKSFKMSYLWDNPFLKYRHGPFSRPHSLPISSDAVRIEATYVKFGHERSCTFAIDKNRISIELPKKVIQIPVNHISCCIPKMGKNKMTALEIVGVDKHSYFIDFEGRTLDFVTDRFRQFDIEHKILSNIDKEMISLANRWSERMLSTFALIMRLNHLSGRSFANRSSYPVFPMPIKAGQIRDFEQNPLSRIDSSFWCNFFAPYSRFVDRSSVDQSTFLSTFESETELSSDFFSCFETFEGLDLPTFAKNKYEFVYFMRGFLEGDDCSRTIHTWISSAFRFICPPRQPSHQETSSPTKLDLCPFVSGTVINHSFLLFRKDSSLVTFDIKDKELKQSHIKGADITFLHTSKKAFFFDKSNGRLLTLSGEEMNLGTNVKAIHECDKALVVWTGNHEVITVDPPEIISHFRVPREEASCFFSSIHFGVVAMGTMSGKLCVFDLVGGKLLFCIDLHGRVPRNIVVTTGFGFIFVYCFHYLAVFTINGSLICESETQYDIVSVCPYLNHRGFDFVLISDERGKIFSVEVFNLSISDAIFQVHSDIGMLRYDWVSREIITATKDGVGYLIPYHRDETVANL